MTGARRDLAGPVYVFPSFPSFRPFVILLVVIGLMNLVFYLHQYLFGENIKIEIAAQNGDLAMVEQLIKAKPALVSSRYYIGTHWTPLQVAAAGGHKDVAAFLLACGADINATDDDGQTPLHYAALHGRRDVVELLLASKAEVNVFDAAAVGDLARVKAMVQANPDLVFSKDYLGFTPLYWAACAGHKDAMEFLLANKAEVNAKGKGDATPLHGAAGEGHKDAVEMLLANGADVNAKNKRGQTPLFAAAWMNRKDVVQMLLDHKADVNARDNDGKTALYRALEVHRGAVATLLSQHGGRE